MAELIDRLTSKMRSSQTLRLVMVGILGLIMYATRNVNWYATGARDQP